MHPVYKITRAHAQEERDANLADLLAELTFDYAPAPPATAEQGQADPRWIAIIARKVKGVAAHREIARRHGAPGRLPSRTPAAANDDTPAEPIAAPVRVTKLVTKRSRRKRRKSVLRQSVDARKMRAHGQAARGEAVGNLHPLSHPSAKQKITKHAPTTYITASNSNTAPTHHPERALAAWPYAGDLPQIIAINRALDEFGVPFAFSLNLDPDLIRAANANRRGFCDFIRRRVVRILSRELGRTVTMWVMVETDKHGREHCHGGLAMNDNEAPAAFERALAEAGGNWTRPGSRCADVRRQWQADGWAVYPAKAMTQTRGDLRRAAGLDPDAPVALWSCTNDLRAAGKAIHAKLRRSLDPRSIKIDVTLEALASTDDAGLPLDREADKEHGVVTVNKKERFLAPILKDDLMHPRLITDEVAADLLDASTIAHRVHNGAATVILGIHKELGPWTLMQTTTREFYVTSEADPADLGAFLAATSTAKAA